MEELFNEKIDFDKECELNSDPEFNIDESIKVIK